MLALVNWGGTFDSATGGTFQSDTDGTFHSDIPGTFESDMGGTFKVLQSKYGCLVTLVAIFPFSYQTKSFSLRFSDMNFTVLLHIPIDS